MFAFGELSDLKDGTLVIPMKVNGKDVECTLEDGTTGVIYTFDDFDFDIKPEDRKPKPTPIDTTVIEINLDDKTYNYKVSNYKFYLIRNEEPDFYWIKQGKKLIFSEKINI